MDELVRWIRRSNSAFRDVFADSAAEQSLDDEHAFDPALRLDCLLSILCVRVAFDGIAENLRTKE